MHVKYKAAVRQSLPKGIIRSALDAQEALVEAIMADLKELASKGSQSAAVVGLLPTARRPRRAKPRHLLVRPVQNLLDLRVGLPPLQEVLHVLPRRSPPSAQTGSGAAQARALISTSPWTRRTLQGIRRTSKANAPGPCSGSARAPRSRSASPPIRPRRRAAWATSKRRTRAALCASRAARLPVTVAKPPLGRDRGPAARAVKVKAARARRLRALLQLTGHAGAPQIGGSPCPEGSRPPGRIHADRSLGGAAGNLRPCPRRRARRAGLPTPGHHYCYR